MTQLMYILTNICYVPLGDERSSDSENERPPLGDRDNSYSAFPLRWKTIRCNSIINFVKY